MLKKIRGLARILKMSFNNFKIYTKRKGRALRRNTRPESFPRSYHFAIVAVKREPYVKLAIDNINSLHYINSSHKISFYCDDICEKEFKKLIHKLDYPKQVEIINKFGNSNEPWQYSKLETTIEISKKGWKLVDADAVWHHDPVLEKDRVTLLISNNKISDKPDEKAITLNIFNHPEWLSFGYYSSGFISIPAKFMNDKVASDSRSFLKMIMENNLSFIENERARGDQKRQAEQFALNLGLLTNWGEKIMTTLKDKDGTKDTNLLQSLYYGCAREIND